MRKHDKAKLAAGGSIGLDLQRTRTTEHAPEVNTRRSRVVFSAEAVPIVLHSLWCVLNREQSSSRSK